MFHPNHSHEKGKGNLKKERFFDVERYMVAKEVP